MTLTPERLAAHMARFIDMLAAAFRGWGADGLPEPLRRAVLATPRHLFVHRFRIANGPLRTLDDDGATDLADIYSDAVMTHVDAAGDRLPSTNSQPSYVLWLLHLLDLQPGQRVLEIGSGSGWLAAIMAHLVGPDGHVTGVEVLPDLAARSRADLAGLGIGNVSVVAGDGGEGWAAGAPFDRAMITAAVWDVPAALFDQVAPDGRLLAPIEMRSGGCHVAALRRDRDGFIAEQAIPGWFVPLLGPGQRRPVLRQPLERLTIWPEVGGAPARRVPLPLGSVPGSDFPGAATAFRAFLSRVAPGFTVFGAGEPPRGRWALAGAVEPFGVVDEARRSVACWRAGTLLGYGGPSAMAAVVEAYARWAALGMPGLTGMGLAVRRSGAAPMAGWRDDRGTSVLIWSPLLEAEAWQALLPPGESWLHADAGLP